jgi:hypothetical protein
MTRDLSDARGDFSIGLRQTADVTATASGAGRNIGNQNTDAFSTWKGTPVPGYFTKFRVTLFFAWTTNPAADDFPVYVAFANPASTGSTATLSDHGARFGKPVYPDTATGLTGTLADNGAAGGFANSFTFVSDWVTMPSAWQTHGATYGWYSFLGVWLVNNSGGSLTDNYANGHASIGLIEFLR